MFLVYQGDLGHGLVKQLVKFAVVGIFNTFLDIALYFLLSRYVGIFQQRLVWAKGIAYILGTINSFLWNRSWTFRSQIKSQKTIMPFMLLSFASVAINTGTMYVCLTALHLNELVSLVLATLVVFAWNFTTSKYLVFQQ
jgi:putative flippase GtrA